MSHSIQAALTLPVVIAGLSYILATGPACYSMADHEACLHYEYMKQQASNGQILSLTTIVADDLSATSYLTSAEQMEFLLDSIEDSACILLKGVT